MHKPLWFINFCLSELLNFNSMPKIDVTIAETSRLDIETVFSFLEAVEPSKERGTNLNLTTEGKRTWKVHVYRISGQRARETSQRYL